MLRYSPIDERPHPPGYLLYIASAHIFNFFFYNENLALFLAIVSPFDIGLEIVYLGERWPLFL